MKGKKTAETKKSCSWEKKQPTPKKTRP